MITALSNSGLNLDMVVCQQPHPCRLLNVCKKHPIWEPSCTTFKNKSLILHQGTMMVPYSGATRKVIGKQSYWFCATAIAQNLFRCHICYISFSILNDPPILFLLITWLHHWWGQWIRHFSPTKLTRIIITSKNIIRKI